MVSPSTALITFTETRFAWAGEMYASKTAGDGDGMFGAGEGETPEVDGNDISFEINEENNRIHNRIRRESNRLFLPKKNRFIFINHYTCTKSSSAQLSEIHMAMCYLQGEPNHHYSFSERQASIYFLIKFLQNYELTLVSEVAKVKE